MKVKHYKHGVLTVLREEKEYYEVERENGDRFMVKKMECKEVSDEEN